MIFLRHPPPAIPAGRCYGRQEVPVVEDALTLAPIFDAMPWPAEIRSSPSRRCMGLAERLADHFSLPVTQDPDLRELDFGAWEGMQWDDIPRDQSDPWAADPWTTAPPGGERFCDLHGRVCDAIARALDGAVLVTHAGVIRAARMIITGARFDDVFAEPVAYCTPIRIGAGGR